MLSGIIRPQMSAFHRKKIKQHCRPLRHKHFFRIRIGKREMAFIQFMDIKQSRLRFACIQDKLPQLLRHGHKLLPVMNLPAFNIMFTVSVNINLPVLTFRFGNKTAAAAFHIVFLIIPGSEITVFTVNRNQPFKSGCGIGIGIRIPVSRFLYQSFHFRHIFF